MKKGNVGLTLRPEDAKDRGLLMGMRALAAK